MKTLITSLTFSNTPSGICKILFSLLCLLFLSSNASSQIHEFDGAGYANITFYPIGLLSGTQDDQPARGYSIGGVHLTGMEVWKHTVFEMSAFKLGHYSYQNPWSDPEIIQRLKGTKFLDLVTVDIGVNVIIKKRLSIGIVPYSFTYSNNASHGLAVLSKFRASDRLVFEAKIVPVPYFVNYDQKFYDNNSYVGFNYYFGENLSPFSIIGIRHNRQGGINTTNLSLVFNLY